MKTLRCLGVAALFCCIGAAGAWAADEVIDFESEPTGQILSTVNTSAGTGPIPVFGFRPTAPPGVNTAVVFDSSNPPGLDFDLGSPNWSCPVPGPGLGLGGQVDMPNENCTALGKVLIVAANLGDGNGDGLVDVPNDADEVGASLEFDFSVIGPVIMKEITLIDVEAEEPQALVELFDDTDTLIAMFVLEQTGDNGKTIRGLGPTPGVHRMLFTINGSGAIDDIVFAFDEPECGDGEVNQPGETCDPPGSTPDETYPDNLCREDCTYCGDGNLDEGEECDFNAPNAPENCTETCEIAPFCGDDILQAELGETCEPPGSNAGQPNECREDCTYCGDEVLDAGEQCDDGNNIDGDGCSADCDVELFCGDGVVNQPGETCDPPGSNAGQPNECRGDCTYCGDGVLDSGEQCDDGNNIDGDLCSAYCLLEPFCGDGLINLPGETCEPPGSNPGEPDECRLDCTYCGDGVLDEGEECDDGNNLDGDECDAYCMIETLGCRFTGGGVDTDGNWDHTLEDGETIRNGVGHLPNGIDRYTFGGQAGANTALPPQPKGEWTHHQQQGPSGKFTFHGGTASAPELTEIDEIRCNDPGFCNPARHAPTKQLDFDGVGTFKNVGHGSNAPIWAIAGAYVDEEGHGNKDYKGSYHWFEVNIDDLGEPGNDNDGTPGSPTCPDIGFGEKGAQPLANCECPDFYRITIYDGVDKATLESSGPNKTDVIYEAYGYVDGGNLQIHPLTGFDKH